MSPKQLTIVCLTVVLSNSAYPADMTLVGPVSVQNGDSFQVEILGDFSGVGLIAGGITFFYDDALVTLDNAVLELNNIVPDFSCDAGFNLSNVGCPPNTVDSAAIVWGGYLAPLISPEEPAPTLMATLSFTAVGTGNAQFHMVSEVSTVGSWLDSHFWPIDTPAFTGTSVIVVDGADQDADGVPDQEDNCMASANTDQRDTDGDSIGNRCDPDFTNSCLVNLEDLAIFRGNLFGTGDLMTDLNGDGLTNFSDLIIFTGFFLSPPGPSGLPNDCQ